MCWCGLFFGRREYGCEGLALWSFVRRAIKEGGALGGMKKDVNEGWVMGA